jgi:phage-related protein
MKLLPTIEKLIGFVTTAIEKFSALPGPVQNVILGITALVAIGGPLLTFLASAKTAMVTLGLVSEASAVGIGLSTIAANLLRVALAGLGIGLVIAAIVLLVQNWDSISAAVSKFWEKIKDVVPKAWAKVMELKDKIVGYIDTIKDVFNGIPGALFNVGKNIVTGLWDGIQSMGSWLKNRIFDFFGNLVPGWAKKVFGINSPSTVFAAFGENIVEGLAQGITSAQNIAKNATLSLGNATVSGLRMPALSTGRSTSPIAITINAGLGTNGPALGRQVSSAIRQYGKVSTQARF